MVETGIRGLGRGRCLQGVNADEGGDRTGEAIAHSELMELEKADDALMI
jgi:hypothetical protein